MPARRPLGGVRVDTIEALGAGDVCEHAGARLAEMWRARFGADARLAPEDEDVEGLGPSLRVHVARRGGQYPVMLVSPHWRLQLSPWSGAARLILSAQSLASDGLEWARGEIERVGRWLYGADAADPWQLSRLDLCVDYVGLQVSDYADPESAVMRSASVTLRGEGDQRSPASESMASRSSWREVTSVTIGSAASRFQACVYDKSRQIEQSEGSRWVEGLWRDAGWRGERVVRVEVRYRGGALDELEDGKLRALSCLSRASEWIGPLWRYATTRALRYCIPGSATRRERWATRADWRDIQATAPDARIATRVRAVAVVAREARIRRARRQVARGLASLVAEHDATLAGALRGVADCLAAEVPATVALWGAVFGGAEDYRDLERELVPRHARLDDDLERARHVREALQTRAQWRRWSDDAYYAWCESPASERAPRPVVRVARGVPLAA